MNGFRFAGVYALKALKSYFEIEHMQAHTRLYRYFAGFRPVGLAFALFSLLNLALFLLISLHPPLLEGLWLSTDRPWGILTSMFVHWELDHLASNLIFFTIWSALFVTVNLLSDTKARKRWSRFFLWAVFLAGIAANAIEFGAWGLTGVSYNSWGASGVVYAAMGVLLASALYNLPSNLTALRTAVAKRRRKSRKIQRRLKLDLKFEKIFLVTMVSVGVVIVFLSQLVQDPGAFFSAGPGVDVLAHELGFLLGFLPAMILFHIHFFKRGTRRKR